MELNKIEVERYKEELELAVEDNESSSTMKNVAKDVRFRMFELKKDSKESPRKKLGKDFLSKMEKMVKTKSMPCNPILIDDNAMNTSLKHYSNLKIAKEISPLKTPSTKQNQEGFWPSEVLLEKYLKPVMTPTP